MNSIVRYTLKCISYFIVTFVVLFAMLLVGVKLFGIQVYTVLSGSMEPTYKVGSLIYVIDIDVSDLKEKDVITFKISENVVATHRIVEIVDEGNGKKFRTQGDANDFVDEGLVDSKNIVGKPVFTIPYLGYIASFMQTFSGKMITIGVGLLLVIVVVAIDMVTDDKKKKIDN